jgi:acyl-coenzyme A thioesterase PaaI-like protein
MPESSKSRIERFLFNRHPTYWSTGGVITYMADDWREVKVKLPLKLRTRNVLGTIFGGAMYSSIDPIYVLMLLRNLGSGYVVWDKSATIRFKKPGKSTLYAHFKIDENELNTIRDLLKSESSIDRVYNVDLADKDGVIHATVEKVIYIRCKTQG